MHLIALIVPGQGIHHQIGPEPIRQHALPRATGDCRMRVLAIAVHRPGRRPIMTAQDHRAHTVIGAVLIARHPNLPAGKTPRQFIQQVKGAVQDMVFRHRD